MGMRSYSFNLLNQAFQALGKPSLKFKRRGRYWTEEGTWLEGVRILELGAQIVRDTKNTPAKVFLSEYGATHVSIDLNGEFGSIAIDLSTEDTLLDIKEGTGLDQFDVITNYGTTEHLYPFTAQYPTFRNIHDLCRVGGIMVHEVPMSGYWKGHSPAHYHKDFFATLAERCGYRLIYSDTCGPSKKHVNTAAALQKTDAGFCSEEDFPAELIAWNGGGRRGKFHEQKGKK
jgi:hypothetical protein